MAEHMAQQNAEGSRDLSTLVDASAELRHLVQTIWRLRQPDGCPWDREQTHQSIGKNMIEEAYEALDCIEDVWDEVAEERAEFEAEDPGSPEREMEFGDLLFALVNVARKEGIDAESALRASTAKFRRRWAAMEQMAADAHVDLAELSTHGLNDLWDAAKAEE